MNSFPEGRLESLPESVDYIKHCLSTNNEIKKTFNEGYLEYYNIIQNDNINEQDLRNKINNLLNSIKNKRVEKVDVLSVFEDKFYQDMLQRGEGADKIVKLAANADKLFQSILSPRGQDPNEAERRRNQLNI